MQTPATARLVMLLLLTPAHYPGNALEKESRTRAVTQLPLTLSTRAFFPTHDRAYERADEKSDELCTSIARSDAKNTEDHGRVYQIVLR